MDHRYERMDTSRALYALRWSAIAWWCGLRFDDLLTAYPLHRTTDYAPVLLPLPGISNDLEVVRLL